MPSHPTLLTIAGSDPSGGAGIQADLKTMTSIGVYGAAAITCLTVQNSYGVQDIFALEPEFIAAQIEAVLSDHEVSHIKIGMTGQAAIIQTLGRLLQSFGGEVIYDPVLATTTGESLLSLDDLSLLSESLISQVSYLTPNTRELQLLSGSSIATRDDALSCARILLHKHPSLKAVVVKGGHLEGSRPEISDYLVRPASPLCESRRQRLNNPHLHGTGCSYASALASYLCLGHDIMTAFKLTGKYMGTLISLGGGKSVTKNPQNGPLMHALIQRNPG